MTMTQQGIYLNILIYQWVYGDFPRNAWELSRTLNSSYDTTLRLLSDYSHLFVCCECSASWSRADCECGASKSRGTCENPRLRNIRVDVNSDLPIGTTEPNLTITSPKVTPTCAPSGGEGGGRVSTSVVEGYFDQAKQGMAKAAVVEEPTPNPLADQLVGLLGTKAPDPKVYGDWARLLGHLQDAHGQARYQSILAYCFKNERYCRGIKTTGKDKVLWLMDKFDGLGAKMDADEEFKKASKPKEQDNRPEYLKNPSGKAGFGKTVA
jgi:hypothetical protein